jgi:hypothetical protein
MTVTLLRGDALHLPLADHTVDLVSSPYLAPVFGEVLSAGQPLQVLQSVVKRVTVAMVDNRTAGQWSVRRLPCHDGAESPKVLVQLDPCSGNPSVSAFLHAPDRKPVARAVALGKLGRDRSPLALRNRCQSHVRLGATGTRAVVDGQYLGRFLAELSAADRARHRNRCPLRSHSPFADLGIVRAASRRAEHLAACGPAYPIWLYINGFSARRAGGFHAMSLAPGGTGTTAHVPWRTTDPGQLAQAAQVDKPPAQTVGQDALFEVTG